LSQTARSHSQKPKGNTFKITNKPFRIVLQFAYSERKDDESLKKLYLVERLNTDKNIPYYSLILENEL
jgi:hypothetical protein